jgi:hypothetical protein
MQKFRFLTMALLRMFQRAAFICNVCFLLALAILWIKRPVNEGLASVVIVMGFFLSVILNFILLIWLLILRILKKSLSQIPCSLIYLNAGFFFIQVVLLIKSVL